MNHFGLDARDKPKTSGQAPTQQPAKRPGHYGDWAVGDFIAARGLDFFEGNVIKYVTRHKKKDKKKDLLKARDYLDKLIELTYPE